MCFTLFICLGIEHLCRLVNFAVVLQSDKYGFCLQLNEK